MSDPVATTPTPKKEAKPLPKWIKWAIVALIIVLVFGFQGWLGGRRIQGAREEFFKQGVNALAASLTEVMIERNPAKAQKMIEQIARDGGYSLVIVTNATGQVLATTDRAKVSTTIEELKKPPTDGAKIERIPEGLRGDRAIAIGGDSILGGLRVETKLSN